MFKLNDFDNAEKDTIKTVFVWFFLSGFFAIFYYQTVLYPSLETLPNWFEKILHGNADSPYNYRLLVPSLYSAFDLVSPLKSNHDYFISTFIVFSFSIATLMWAVSFQVSDRSSVNSLLFASFFILLTFSMGGVQPWSYIDIGLYALAYVAVVNTWKTPYYLILLSFALLNRETGILLSIVPLLIAALNNKGCSTFSLYKKELSILFFGLMFFLLIRYLQGAATHVITIEQVFLRNFSPETLIINTFVYSGAFCWLFIGGSFKLNNVEKAFVGILILNVVLILFFGLFREIRMFVPYAFLFGLIFSRNTNKARL